MSTYAIGDIQGCRRSLAGLLRLIEFEPVKWITFDGRRVKAHAAGLWAPGQPWVEPDEEPG